MTAKKSTKSTPAKNKPTPTKPPLQIDTPESPPKKLTLAEIMALKVPVTKRVRIQLDGSLSDNIARLESDLITARRADSMSNQSVLQTPKIQTELDELNENSLLTEVTFVFKSIGHMAYDKLVESPVHKPTKAQAKEGSNFNPLTFPQAIIAASCIEPVMTLEEVKELFLIDSWNNAELTKLFYGALECNSETGDTPLSLRGLSGMLSSVQSLITP